MKIALSAASSFTGFWIARTLRKQGWEVLPLSSSAPGTGEGLRGLRMKLLEKDFRVQFGVASHDGSMVRWIHSNKPEIWVHHHHFMEEFRSPQYDTARAIEVGIKPLSEIVHALVEGGCRGIVYSGSYFEPGEGGAQTPAERTPYARSKKMVWDELSRQAGAAGIPLSKVVIPNPVGPFENVDRLIPILIQSSLMSSVFKVTQPASTSDNIPWHILADVYAEAIQNLSKGNGKIFRPSGRVSSTLDFVNEIEAELLVRGLGLKKPLVEVNTSTTTSSHFSNPVSERRSIDWSQTWSQYAEWLKQTNALEFFRK